MMNLKKVLDKMPQYLLLLKLAFSCQIRTLHLMVLELEQCCCSEVTIHSREMKGRGKNTMLESVF